MKEILIADADKADQEEFRKFFEATDYHLTFSESGNDALLRLKLFKPDMIIASGGGLREMTGLELCGAIKEDEELRHIPFILISSIFDQIPEKERRRVQADGMILKPFNEDEVLNLVDQLMEEGAIGKGEKRMSEKEEGFLLNEIGEGEEEIIELVDVVEEPEARISIDHFVAPQKEEPLGELTSLESWEKLEFEEKELEKEFELQPQKEFEKITLPLKEEQPAQELPSEEELFQKIELEEILEKVEQMKPSLEQEWPIEKEEKEMEERLFRKEEPAETSLDLSEFEAALQKEVTSRASSEVELQPFMMEEPKETAPEIVLPEEEAVEEEQLVELPEEEFPDELLEEILREEEISPIEEPKEEVHEAIQVDRLEREEIPPILPKEVLPSMGMLDLSTQELLSKKVQEMMQEIVTKLVPEMTQNMVRLTLERIEKMVKEVVPDLAEKAIQEEIKRLQEEKE